MAISPNERIECGIIGYGATFHFGRAHGTWINATGRMRVRAVCSRSPERRNQAAADFPGITTYATTAELLADSALDLVAVVTPHFTHRELVVQALQAGKHVVVDKAMACTVAECTAMIDTAAACRRTLAVFHNRQFDGNFRRVQQLVAEGAIGDVFEVACYCGWYGHPARNWYAEQAASGGVMFLWGPHAMDWVFRLVPDRVVSVDAYGQKRLWHDVDVLDQQRLIMRFDHGTTAELTFSHIAVAPLPLWRILGTRGAIIDSGERADLGYCPTYQDELPPQGKLTLVRREGGQQTETELPYLPSTWGQYYRELAAHLLAGTPPPVSGEVGRRTIAVLEAANRSCVSGHTEVPEFA